MVLAKLALIIIYQTPMLTNAEQHAKL